MEPNSEALLGHTHLPLGLSHLNTWSKGRGFPRLWLSFLKWSTPALNSFPLHCPLKAPHTWLQWKKIERVCSSLSILRNLSLNDFICSLKSAARAIKTNHRTSRSGSASIILPVWWNTGSQNKAKPAGLHLCAALDSLPPKSFSYSCWTIFCESDLPTVGTFPSLRSYCFPYEMPCG